jgi:methylenetetrahydrofolate dehydrogenase (NADP+)/methenyltetrahydrofolate cyclohydrolase
VCHSRTEGLARIAAAADVLIAAVGRPGFVTRDYVKPGATVIDVGINVLTSESDVFRFFPADSPKRKTFAQKGSVLIGDVHPDVDTIAGAITPVPGGVGPLTIAMVLRNTITAAERRCSGSR